MNDVERVRECCELGDDPIRTHASFGHIIARLEAAERLCGVAVHLRGSSSWRVLANTIKGKRQLGVLLDALFDALAAWEATK